MGQGETREPEKVPNQSGVKQAQMVTRSKEADLVGIKVTAAGTDDASKNYVSAEEVAQSVLPRAGTSVNTEKDH